MPKTDLEPRLRGYATRLQSEFVDEAAAIAQRAAATPNRGWWTSRSLGRAAAALLVVTVSVGSLGVVANASVPGQLLYPVDQSIETVLSGIGLSTADQRLAERTHEAQVLVDLGDPELALQTLLAGLDAEFAVLSPHSVAEHATPILDTTERAVAAGGPNQVETLSGLALEVRDYIGPGPPDSVPAPTGEEGTGGPTEDRLGPTDGVGDGSVGPTEPKPTDDGPGPGNEDA